MQKRSRRAHGLRTKKISISVSEVDLKVLKARARRLYRGNLSAVVHELAAAVKRDEAGDELLAMLRGDRITEQEMQAARDEVAAAPTGRRKRSRAA